MGYTNNSHFCPKFQTSTAFFIILLILSSTRARFTFRGVSNSKLTDNYTQVIKNENDDYGKVGMRNMIGSKPPRCDWKKYCIKCGKCEAIQVPISRSSNTTARRDGISNYKAMCWECKCGDFTFNP